MLDLILAVQLFTTDPIIEDTTQPQLCEEQIGRRIDIDDVAYVVVSVDENCDPVMEIIQEDSPLWDCTTMGNDTCGVEIDGVWWLIHYVDGCEVSRELRDAPVVVPTEEPVATQPPALVPTNEPAVVPTPVVEIADVAPNPTPVPELAETGYKGTDAMIIAFMAAALVFSGWGLLALTRRKR